MPNFIILLRKKKKSKEFVVKCKNLVTVLESEFLLTSNTVAATAPEQLKCGWSALRCAVKCTYLNTYQILKTYHEDKKM